MPLMLLWPLDTQAPILIIRRFHVVLSPNNLVSKVIMDILAVKEDLSG